jgi:(R,R)-butanediol dehydrogenase/meso-butanediol dehydrogenase/diacetyl reductase
VVLVSQFEGAVQFQPNNLLMMERKMMFVLVYSQKDIEDVIRIIGGQSEWKKRVASMITLKVGLNDAVSKGFDGLINHRQDHVKILITAQSCLMN